MPEPAASPRLRRAPRALLPLPPALLLAACAAFPPAQPAPEMRAPASYDTAESFAAPAVSWPEDRWWQRYGDPGLDLLVDEALAGSPDLAAAAARLHAAEAATRVAGAALLPKASVNGTIAAGKQSYNYLMPSFATPQGWAGTGRLAPDIGWEIDFRGRNRAGLAAATSAREATRAELAATRLTLAAAVAADYVELARLHAARDTVEKAVEAVDAAAEAHRVAGNRYRGGLASFLEVLSAEDALLANVRELTDLRSRSFALDVALTRALGGGYTAPKS